MLRTEKAIAITAVVLAGWMSPVAWGHPEQFGNDEQPPYDGPGYRAATAGGDPPPVNFPIANVVLQSWVTLPEFGSTKGNDCWGYVSPSGREYAIIGLLDGTGFVEITDPTNAQIVDKRTGPLSSWRDIKVFLWYAYAVSEGGGGIQVFNMFDIDNGNVTVASTVTTPGTTATHNVAIDTDSNFLYRCGGGGGSVGLRIYSLSDPAQPAFRGEWHDRYVHDAQVVTYKTGPYAGRQIAFCFSETGSGGGNPGVDILDVTSKSNIIPLSFISYSNPAFSHQGWLSEDRRFLFLNDEVDELSTGVTTTTRVLDVSDLENPFEVTTFTNGSTSIDHNLYTKGNLIFAANYRSGLRVFKADDPLTMAEVGYFDTYPDDDNPNFNGLWSVFPYFPSNTVIGSDIEKGLFVWRLSVSPFVIETPDGVPDELDLAGDSIRVKFVDLTGSWQIGTGKLHYDLGGGYLEEPLVQIDADHWEAVFPFLDCGQQVSFFLSGESTEGEIITNPPGGASAAYQASGGIGAIPSLIEDMELHNPGWAVGEPTDTATAGIWERVDPVGTLAQPEDDHTEAGTHAWVTGQGNVGDPDGANDVDGGATTLLSPIFDLSGPEPASISYWRWFSSIPSGDVFVVDITNDGVNWVNVEALGPGGPDTIGGWRFHELLVEDYVAQTSYVRLRFIASDFGSSSLVEAAVDDLIVSTLDCGCIARMFGDVAPPGGNGVIDVDDVLCVTSAFSGALGCPDADLIPCGGNDVVDVDDILGVLAAFGGAELCPDPCEGQAASGQSPPLGYRKAPGRSERPQRIK